MIGQLTCAVLTPFVEQICQDHDIAIFGQPVNPFHSAGNRHLPVHLGIEEAVEQSPDVLLLYKFLRFQPPHGGTEIIANQVE